MMPLIMTIYCSADQGKFNKFNINTSNNNNNNLYLILFLNSGSVKLSKKALNQRDADENLCLRFLELDSPAEQNAILLSQKQQQNGRTPFTVTKKLNRNDGRGFGFSIVWTHPPRIANVEADSVADRCGIVPGDYLIFVGNHNVVTMPEMDILNLLKAQENTLILEIFRRTPQLNGTKLREANKLNTKVYQSHANNMDQHILSQPATSKQSTSSSEQSTRRITTACSNISVTLDATQQRLHMPQVTFSKEVGCGVIV